LIGASQHHPPSSGGTFLIHTPLSNAVHLRIEVKDLTALRDELRARRPFAAEPDPARCRSDQVCYLIEDDPLEGDESEN